MFLCAYVNFIIKYLIINTNSKTSKFKSYPYVGRQKKGFKDVYILIPKPCNSVTLYGKKRLQGCY